jgi:hypothetical protein
MFWAAVRSLRVGIVTILDEERDKLEEGSPCGAGQWVRFYSMTDDRSLSSAIGCDWIMTEGGRSVSRF